MNTEHLQEKTILKSEKMASFLEKGATIVYEGHLTLLAVPFRQTKFDVIVSNDACVVLYIDEEDMVWFIKEYRVPPQKEVLGLPAETLDNKDEPILQRAIGGLREECGIEVPAEQFEYVTCVYSSEGHDTEKVYLFVARGPHKHVGQQLGETEEISIEKIPFTQAYGLYKEGKLTGSKATILLQHEYIRRLEQ